MGGTRRALRLAVQHHDELLTASCPEVLAEAARLLATDREEERSLPAAAAWRFALAHHRRGEYQAAVELCEAADLAGAPVVDRARLLAVHADAVWAQGAARESRDLADRALHAARESGDDEALAAAWTAQALAFALEGDRDSNQHAYERALEHAALAADTLTMIRVHSNFGSLHNEAGRYTEALTHLDRAVALAENHPAGLLGAISNINRAEALLGLGRLDEALLEAATARELYRAAASPMLAFALLVEAEVHRTRGNAVRAMVAYTTAVARAEHGGNAQVLVPALAGLARTSILDDPATATSHAKRALEQPAALGTAKAHLAAGWVALAGGDHDEAGHCAQQAIVLAGGRHALPDLADALELRALARGDHAGALEDLHEAGAIWREIGNSIRLEVNRLVVARHARERGAADAARQALSALGVAVDAYRIAGPLQAVTASSRSEVEVRTLGSFSVSVAGEPVPASSWPSRKSRDLIKVLAARRGRSIRRESLAELLWPGVRDTSNRLSVALSTARAALDPGKQHPPDRYVVADREQVHLDLTTMELDTAVFEHAAKQGLAAAADGHQDAVQLLQSAAALHPAPFLDDESAPEWADETRDELQGLALRVKRALVELLTAASETSQAIAWLLALIADDPYDEGVHLDLIVALSLAGRHGEARRAHRTYAARMAELDIEPRSLAEVLGRGPGPLPPAPQTDVSADR